MQKIKVHLEVVSESLSLDEVARILGMKPSPCSHSMGEEWIGRKIRVKWDETCWKTEQIKVSVLSFNEIMQGFKASGIPLEHICDLALSCGLEVNVVAGCFTDAGNLSLYFDPSTMSSFSKLGANIEICFYACSEMTD